MRNDSAGSLGLLGPIFVGCSCQCGGPLVHFIYQKMGCGNRNSFDISSPPQSFDSSHSQVLWRSLHGGFSKNYFHDDLRILDVTKVSIKKNHAKNKVSSISQAVSFFAWNQSRFTKIVIVIRRELKRRGLQLWCWTFNMSFHRWAMWWGPIFFSRSVAFIINFQHLDENTFPGENGGTSSVTGILSQCWLIFALVSLFESFSRRILVKLFNKFRPAKTKFRLFSFSHKRINTASSWSVLVRCATLPSGS